MSEYQYYHFERLEGYLDNHQRHKLRDISSRADISATSFGVIYHYGDLKANSSDLMLNYFDIGFYYSNWGCIEAYIKLPVGTIPSELFCCETHYFELYEDDKWQLLLFTLEDYDTYFDDADAEAFCEHLVSLRSELIYGDWRLMYMLWLSLCECDSQVESIPLLNFDFNQLTQAQHAFAELFNIPLGLTKALVLMLQDHPSHTVKQAVIDVKSWLNQLSETNKDQLLTALFEQGQLSREQALSMSVSPQANVNDTYQYWLSSSVITSYFDRGFELEKQEYEQKSAAQAETDKAARQALLADIYLQREQIWQRIEDQSKRACASAYNQASSDLHDLAEAYQFKDNNAAFTQRLNRFTKKHHSRKALLQRLQDLVVKS